LARGVANAQLVLPPKPEKVVVVKTEKGMNAKIARGIISSLPAKGWHFETSLGVAIWGIESQCRCNAITADLGFHYVASSGLLLGSNLLVTNTISTSLSPTFKIGYQHIRKADGAIGKWSTSLIAGPGITNLIRSSSTNTDKYRGFIYGGEVGFHPRLGQYSQLRGIMAIGWLTQKETFNSDDWRGPTETRMTHSGVRLRFGITI